jgi:hypothetical protein
MFGDTQAQQQQATTNMSFPAYHKRVIDCTSPVDTSRVEGKSVITTGGKSS